MTDIPGTQATNGNPTHLGRGDPAGRFADYYPAWVDKLADDVTLEGSMLDGALQFLAGEASNRNGRDFTSHQRVPDGIQQRGQRRERDRLRVSPGRRGDARWCCCSTFAATSTTGIPRSSMRSHAAVG